MPMYSATKGSERSPQMKFKNIVNLTGDRITVVPNQFELPPAQQDVRLQFFSELKFHVDVEGLLVPVYSVDHDDSHIPSLDLDSSTLYIVYPAVRRARHACNLASWERLPVSRKGVPQPAQYGLVVNHLDSGM